MIRTSIKKPITPCGMVGYDEFGQLRSAVFTKGETEEDDYTTEHFICDVRPLICPLCGKGWENTAESLRNQERIGTYPQREGICHKTCVQGFQVMGDRRLWYWGLCGISVCFDFNSIPNEYCCPWRPWYEMPILRIKGSERPKTGMVLKVGMRKHVWHMELTGCRFAGELELLFKEENVTKESGKDRYLIHADNDKKAMEYLAKFKVVIDKEIAKQNESV